MKMKIQYCESFKTFLSYDKYIVDTDKFPELENLDKDYVTQWIVENTENLSVKDNDGQLEIVPYDGKLSILTDVLTEGGIQREKTLDNDNWFEYLGEEDDDAEDDSEDEDEDEDNDDEDSN